MCTAMQVVCGHGICISGEEGGARIPSGEEEEQGFLVVRRGEQGFLTKHIKAPCAWSKLVRDMPTMSSAKDSHTL